MATSQEKTVQDKHSAQIISYVVKCTGSCWDGVNFPRSRPYSAELCIRSYNGVVNTPVFWLLLSCIHRASRLSLQPLCPAEATRLEWVRGWEGTYPWHLTQTDQRNIPYNITSCLAIKA